MNWLAALMTAIFAALSGEGCDRKSLTSLARDRYLVELEEDYYDDDGGLETV